MTNEISMIPNEILWGCLSFLSPRELVYIAQVSKQFNSAVDSILQDYKKTNDTWFEKIKILQRNADSPLSLSMKNLFRFCLIGEPYEKSLALYRHCANKSFLNPVDVQKTTETLNSAERKIQELKSLLSDKKDDLLFYKTETDSGLRELQDLNIGANYGWQTYQNQLNSCLEVIYTTLKGALSTQKTTQLVDTLLDLQFCGKSLRTHNGINSFSKIYIESVSPIIEQYPSLHTDLMNKYHSIMSAITSYNAILPSISPCQSEIKYLEEVIFSLREVNCDHYNRLVLAKAKNKFKEVCTEVSHYKESLLISGKLNLILKLLEEPKAPRDLSKMNNILGLISSLPKETQNDLWSNFPSKGIEENTSITEYVFENLDSFASCVNEYFEYSSVNTAYEENDLFEKIDGLARDYLIHE